MALYTNAFFEERVDRLFELAGLVERIFAGSGLEYRVVGGLATYLYVEQSAPDAGRLTRDIDIVVRRQDLERIAAAAETCGLAYRHVAGVDMLVQADAPASRRIHLYPGAVPELGPFETLRGLRLIPTADLIRMKLTSFRLKDQVHLKDLDEAGVISPAVEATLSPVLAERLARVRARE